MDRVALGHCTEGTRGPPLAKAGRRPINVACMRVMRPHVCPCSARFSRLSLIVVARSASAIGLVLKQQIERRALEARKLAERA